MLTALQTGLMFRDMSGVAVTQALAQAALQAASQGEQQAQVEASANMAIEAQKQVEMAKTALGFFQALMGGAPTSSGSGSNITARGAMLNEGKSLDARGAAGAQPNGASSGAAGAGSSGSAGGGGRGVGTTGGGGVSVPPAGGGAPSFEASAFERTMGDPPPAVARTLDALASAIGDSQAPLFQQAVVSGDLSVVENDVGSYQDLLTFEVADAVVKGLAARKLQVQPLDDAVGDLNMDLYQVRISKLPIVNRAQLTPEALLDYVRSNFNDFVDTKIASFAPFENPDKTSWAAPKPGDRLGSVILITMTDTGAVVCSGATSDKWVFTTVRMPPWPTSHGVHPVSGHREFAIRPLPGDAWALGTRGADRTTGFPEGMVEGFPGSGPFARADALWRSFQARVVDFVRSHQGEAEVIPPFAHHCNWEVAKIILRRLQGTSI
jgi:hypothetical protein